MKRSTETVIVLKEHPKQDEQQRQKLMELWRKLSAPAKQA